MKPVKFGIVSTATIAREWVIPAMHASELAEPVAVSSRNAERARQFADALEIPRSYGSFEDLLDDDELEAVYIATPNHEHVDQTIAAAEAGKHVLCEKPIGLNAEQARRLHGLSERTNVLVTEAFMVRYHPRWLAAREIVRSGRLGEIKQIHGTYTVWLPDDTNIRFKAELGGGALGDVGVYPITAARFFFEDEPSSVFGRWVAPKEASVDHSFSGMLEFPGDRHLVFTCSFRLSWAHWLTVCGTEGWMEIPAAVWPRRDQETHIRVRRIDDLRDNEFETITFPPINQYVSEVESFSASIRNNEPSPWPIENAVRNMEILEALRASAKSGQLEEVSYYTVSHD